MLDQVYSERGYRKDEPLDQVLTDLFSRTTPNQKRVLFPIAFTSVSKHGRNNIPGFWEKLREYNPTVIDLDRRNKVRWVLSRLTASKTRVFHVFKKENLIKTKVHFDLKYFHAALKVDKQTQDSFREFFYSKPFLEVFYEDLTSNLGKELATIQTFLGVDVLDLTPKTLKQGIYPLSEVVDNYSEVVEALRGTEYEFQVC